MTIDKDRIKKMVSNYIKYNKNDVELTAKWMAYKLRLGTVGQCRALIQEAMA